MNKAWALLLTLLVAVAGLATATAPAQAGSDLPERTLIERELDGHQKDYKTIILKGRVEELQADGTSLPYAKGKVLLQKKTCKACNWKPNKLMKTNERGVYVSRIGVPLKGRWYWRVRVKASDGFGTTEGRVWATGY